MVADVAREGTCGASPMLPLNISAASIRGSTTPSFIYETWDISIEDQRRLFDTNVWGWFMVRASPPVICASAAAR